MDMHKDCYSTYKDVIQAKMQISGKQGGCIYHASDVNLLIFHCCCELLHKLPIISLLLGPHFSQFLSVHVGEDASVSLICKVSETTFVPQHTSNKLPAFIVNASPND